MARSRERNWFRLGRNGRRKNASRKTPYGCRLGIEPLEERRMLTGSWTTVNSVVPAGDGAQMSMLLSDGSVMVHGGGGFNSAAWYKLAPVNGSYTAGNWSTLTPMSLPRLFFASNVLPSGKVMVLGGEYTGPNTNPATATYDNTGQIYDPVANSWSAMQPFPFSQFGDDPTEMLPDGRVLAGYINDGSTMFYAPATNTWAPYDSLHDKLRGDASDEESWVKLPDDSILSYDVFSSISTGVGHAQRYVPSTGVWTDTGTLPALLSTNAVGAELGPAFLLPDGRAVFFGGTNNVAYYTPSTNSWSAGPAMPNGYVAADAPAAMMPNGHILLAISPQGTLNANGKYTFPSPAKVYEFDPTVPNPTTANSYTDVTPSLDGFGFTLSNISSFSTTMLVLPTGQVMMLNNSGTIAVFSPFSGPNDAWRPTITNITNDSGSNVFTLTGTQLNGISEGAAYGDDNEMASNYPIVRLTDQAGNISYARTSNWSSTSLFGGTSTVNFTVPGGLGSYLVTVVANGIASNSVLNIQCSPGSGENFTVQANANSNFVDVALSPGGGAVATFSMSAFSALIMTGDAASNTLVINDNLSGRLTTMNGGDGNDFLRVENNGTGHVTENGGNGDDYFDFSFYAGNLSNIAAFTSLEGSAGFDSVFVYDSNNGGTNTYTVNSFGVNRSGFGGVSYDGVEAVALTTGNGGDIVNIPFTSVGISTTLNSHGGHDTINLGISSSVQGIAGDVTINNSPNFSTINADNSADPTAHPFITMYNGNLFGFAPGAINWTAGDVNTLTVSGGSGGNTFFVHSGPTSYTATLNAGGGNDSVVFESDAPGFFAVNGQAGTDDVDVFDSNAIAQTYQITSTGVTRSGLSVTIGTVEALAINAGDAADTFNFSTSTLYALSVDGGGANDTFNVGSPSQMQFSGDVALTGGAGDDTFVWKNASNNWYETLFGTPHYNVSIDGGPGYNTLSEDDTTRGNASYQFFANRIYLYDPVGFPDGSDITYDNMSAIGVTASNGNNPLAVYGVSSDIAAGNQVTIVLNGGNDTVSVYPHDALGNLTINGNIGIIGDAGSDSITFDDTGATGGIDYSFSNPFGASTQDVFGMGLAGLGYTSDFENATVKGGNGDDTFDINQYKSGVPLGIYGGGGNDTLNFGGGNLAANITSISAFGFDGQGGFDTFNVNNTGDANQWTYTAQLTTIQSTRVTGAAYGVTLSEAGTELLNINAGNGTNVLTLSAVAAGETLALYGGAGTDAINLPSSLATILGPLYFYGGGGTNNVNQLSNSATAPTTVHVDQTSVGAYPGDNFYPAGASLHFQNVSSMTLTLGSGADTVFAQPNISATVNIRGGSPTTAPGDTLNLALAAAQNYVLHGTAASGNVTSDNLKTLTYSNFETGPNIDDTAPYIVAQSYNDSGVPTIFVQFSEDVSNALSVDYLQLINTTSAEQVPSAYLNMAYDVGTNTASFTFPGYPGGILPPGDYTATISGSLPDLYGNPLGVETPLAFTVATPPPQLLGDYNLNGEVDTSDYIVWRKTLGNAVTTFSGADGNGDGTIGPEDYDVWRANFGKTLPAAAGNEASLANEQTRTESILGSVTPADATRNATPKTSVLDSALVGRQSRTVFGSESKTVNVESAFASAYAGARKWITFPAFHSDLARLAADHHGMPPTQAPNNVTDVHVAFDDQGQCYDNYQADESSADLVWEAVDKVFESRWGSVDLIAI